MFEVFLLDWDASLRERLRFDRVSLVSFWINFHCHERTQEGAAMRLHSAAQPQQRDTSSTRQALRLRTKHLQRKVCTGKRSRRPC